MTDTHTDRQTDRCDKT